MTDDELSRAVAEKLVHKKIMSVPNYEIQYMNYATNWSLIGPEIEKRWGDSDFQKALQYHWLCGESIPRAACLAILDIDDV